MIQEKQIINIKVTQNLSYNEAKAKFLSSQPKPNVPYSAVVSNSKPMKSIAIQYDANETDPQNTRLKILPVKKLQSMPESQTDTTKQNFDKMRPDRRTERGDILQTCAEALGE